MPSVTVLVQEFYSEVWDNLTHIATLTNSTDFVNKVNRSWVFHKENCNLTYSCYGPMWITVMLHTYHMCARSPFVVRTSESIKRRWQTVLSSRIAGQKPHGCAPDEEKVWLQYRCRALLCQSFPTGTCNTVFFVQKMHVASCKPDTNRCGVPYSLRHRYTWSAGPPTCLTIGHREV